MYIQVKKRILYFIGFAFIFLIFAHQFLQLSGRTRLQRDINNALHTPWFFIITGMIWGVMVNQRWLTSRLQQFSFVQKLIVCSFFCLLLAIGTEAIQVFTARDASLSDVFRDLLGAGSAICVIAAIHFYQKSKVLATCCFLLLALALFFSGFTAVAKSVLYIQERDNIFPDLVNLSNDSRVTFEMEEGNWSLVDGLSTWSGYEQKSVAKITLKERVLPGVYIVDPYPDWSSYQWLNLDVFVNGNSQIPLYIRVRTDQSSGRGSIIKLPIEAGNNNLKIEISNLIPRKEELSEVNVLIISSEQAQAGKVIYIGDIYLD